MLPRALFVCVHNAGRSQMAGAFWESLGGEARSAGSEPAGSVNPVVVDAMAELGIDIAGRIPRRLETEDASWAELVVTMGCGDACPSVPGKIHIDWALDDPAGRDLEAVRRIRDAIRQRLDELAASPPTGSGAQPAAG